MAEVYGAIQSKGAEVHRLGNKSSGLRTVAASWQGSVNVDLRFDDAGRVVADVTLKPWHGAGVRKTIVEALPVDGKPRARR